MKLLPLIWLGMASAGLAGCFDAAAPASGPETEIPPASVTVAKVVYETITQWQEFTGRLEASETVELRPRVSGYINQVVFKEGSLVNKGDRLFVIDPRPFQLEVTRLQAELNSALAQRKLADNDLLRAQSLRKQKVIAIEQLEARQASLEQATALVESVRAQLATERLKLSFTEVTAPIDGRISNARVTAGNYVTAGETPLTILVSNHKMHAYFNADEPSFLRYQQQRPGVQGQRVVMKLTTDNQFQHEGRIDFVDNQVDPRTGTARFRATFDNINNLLTPGLFVRLRVAGTPLTTILIDDKAIATDLANKYVLVLKDDHTLEYRQVIPGGQYAGLRIILKGLSEGEKIVTNGLQRVFPGSKVIPESGQMLRPEVKQKYFSKLNPGSIKLTMN